AAADKRAAKAATKSAKKAKQPTPADTAAAEKDIDISALDIRVGKIIRAWEHESAEKLYCEEIDVGEDSPRKIASGLRPFYKLDEMQDRMVLVLCNLKARNLVGFPSHGMVLCASNADHTAVEFAVPPPTAKIGDRVMFDGITGEPEAENKVAKKKMFEVLAPDLKTDEGGVVVWKG
ncbi:probable methionyl-trna synthetase, partial [Thalassiosira pseudonana CCMP1335]